MGSVYQRGDSGYWWISFTDAAGRRRQESTKSQDRARAEALLIAIEREVEKERELRPRETSKTVASYSEGWLQLRERRGVESWKKDRASLRHALPYIGKMFLEEVRFRHLRDMVRELEIAGKLSPRSVNHVYEAVRVMFRDALKDELIAATPCTLSRRNGDLPKKVDADPAWRAGAVFTRAEVEQIISDERLPEWRRVFWAFLFFGCLRVNEATPRRWRDLQPGEPLDRLSITSSYSLKRRAEKSTKTQRPREMPVHPVLSKLLAAWRLGGWARRHGRKPTDDDLIVPGDSGRILNSNWTLKRFHQDLVLLGLRSRRQHDARRTFVSITRGNGAEKSLLRWCTHGPEGDVVDLYTSPPWPALCGQVLKFDVSLREGKVIRLPLAARGGATAVLRPSEDHEMTQQFIGRGGTRRNPSLPAQVGGEQPIPALSAVSTTEDRMGAAHPGQERSNVVEGLDLSGIGCGR